MMEDLYKGWTIDFEVSGASEFITLKHIEVSEAHDVFLELINFNELEKFAEDGEITTTDIFMYLLDKHNLSDEEFIEEILRNRKEIYWLEYVSEPRVDYFRGWIKEE